MFIGQRIGSGAKLILALVIQLPNPFRRQKSQLHLEMTGRKRVPYLFTLFFTLVPRRSMVRASSRSKRGSS